MRFAIAVLALVAVAGGVALWAQQPDTGRLTDCTLGDQSASFTPEPFPGDVELEKISGLTDVTAAAEYQGGTLLAQRQGRLYLDDDVLWEEPNVLSDGAEQGLLEVHVLGERIYTSLTNSDGDLEIRLRTRPGDYDVWLVVDQPHEFHNSGTLESTPDGNLFVSLGDGGPSGDFYGHPQNLDTFKGSVLRLTPDGGIPLDNPTVDGRPVAQWAYGVRNAWRLHVDSDRLWIADVGNWCVEEINVIPAAGVDHPVNLGWSSWEGTSRGKGEELDDVVFPVLEYDHDGGCAVVGGVVWEGLYLFGDYCGGWVYGYDGTTVYDLDVEVPSLITFAETAGDVWVVSQTDGVFKLRQDT